jgi:hypothetical protein
VTEKNYRYLRCDDVGTQACPWEFRHGIVSEAVEEGHVTRRIHNPEGRVIGFYREILV